jgi:RNA polymerase sigma factor (sigma-70 family)
MADAHHAFPSRHLRILFEAGTVVGLTDRQLLDLFVASRDEAAFTALVERHGPMVLRVCGEVLANHHDAQDAFQATFLVLARCAGSIRSRDSLASWLYGVASRVSACDRSASARRRRHERNWAALHAEQFSNEETTREPSGPLLHAELGRLPERFRAPVVLCYLEGRTYEEAAQLLGCPVGTIKSRLSTARTRLTRRLRSLERELPVETISSERGIDSATVAVPAPLIAATVATAVGRVIGTAASRMAAGVLRAMLMTRLKVAIILILATGSLAGLTLPFAWARVGNAGPADSAARTEDPRSAQAQSEVQQQPAAPRDVKTVFFRVVDRTTKQPLQGVTLKVSTDGRVVSQHVTDESGRIVIPVPEGKFSRFVVAARKDGLAPMKVHLKGPRAAELEIPRTYALAMGSATSIGGTVRDDAGQPIEGVSIALLESDPRDDVREVPDLDGISVRTDRSGHWHIDVVPEGIDFDRYQFTFAHPDFLSVIDSSRSQPNPTAQQLRSRSGVTVLTRGVSITGRVLNREGRPIAGASVKLGRRGWYSNSKTDDQGRFQFRSAAAAETLMSVQADGHAPEVRSVQLRDGLPPLEFRLGPGRTIRGGVADSQGKPLANAYVVVSSSNEPQVASRRSSTDAQGRFVLEHAPNDRVFLSAGKDGYQSQRLAIEPSVNETAFKLVAGAPLRVRGTVTDAATGLPIETFTVVPSVHPGDTLILDSAKVHRGGRYVFSEVKYRQPYTIRIEARGYLSLTSPQYPPDGGEQVFNVRLDKGRWVEGVVHGQDGKPLAGADVIFVTHRGISIEGGKTYQRNHHQHIVTELDGRFSFAPANGDARIVALHDQGYGELLAQQSDEGHTLTLVPWGRIEGTLRVDGKPVAHETIVADLDEQRPESMQLRIQNGNRAQTDEHGHFVIDRLPPGEARVFWQPERHGARKQPDRFYPATFVNVRSGQATRLDMVHEHEPALLGHIIVPGSKETPPGRSTWGAYLIVKTSEVPYPPNLTAEERQVWLHGWRFTEAGRAFRHSKRGFGHSLDLQRDGSFRVDAIQPGAYELHIQRRGQAAFKREFVVPEPASKPGGGSVDLGTITPENAVPIDVAP